MANNNIINEVNTALSKFYKQPVVCGYTFGGYPVVRPANNTVEVLAGGIEKIFMPAIVEDIILHTGKLLEQLEELSNED